MSLREKLLRVAPEEWENEFVRIRPMTTRDDLIYAGDGCRLTDEQREFVNPVWFSLGRAYLAPEDAAARLAVETIDRLIELCRAMPACGFRAEYDRRLTLKGRRVSYGSGKRGIVLGVDSDFRLLIRTEQGSTEALDSGEVRCTDTI